MERKRIIFHVDVNNAFLSWTAVKLLKEGYKIDIRKIPSIIAGDPTLRHGIVLAKSPVAKKYGIVTAETIYSAQRKCRNLKIYPPEHAYYKEQSNLLFQYLSQYTPVIERFSIDECFLDLTGTALLYNDYIKLANKMKEEIKTNFGFTVNIGIASNKLCAKMASDFEKPDKVHTLFQDEIEQKMWPLPVGDLFMVGKSSAKELEKMHIMTIGQLAKTNLSLLKRKFKSTAFYMIQAANGIDDNPVENTRADNKCISVSETLPVDVEDKEKLEQILFYQTEKLGRSLRKQGFYTKTIAVTFKNNQFVSYSHQKKLFNATNRTLDIYQHVLELLDCGWKKDPLRNIGVRLGDLSKTKERQVSLFETQEDREDDKMQETLDALQDKFGTKTIQRASLVKKDKKNDKKSLRN